MIDPRIATLEVRVAALEVRLELVETGRTAGAHSFSGESRPVFTPAHGSYSPLPVQDTLSAWSCWSCGANGCTGAAGCQRMV